MSNKLPKKKKENTSSKQPDNVMKTFFSFNPVGDKVFSLYEDSRKREATVTRHGINGVISMIIIMLIVTLMSYTEKLPSLILASIIVCVIEIGASCFNIYRGKNKKVWGVSIGVSVLFMVANIILLIQS